MKKKWSTVINAGIIVLTLVLVLVFGLRGQDPAESVKALSSMGIGWLGLCLAGYLGFLTCDAMAVGFFLRQQGYKINPLYMMFVAVIGQFYSNVTPGATGGQPLQVYYLHKRGVPVGLASSAMVVRFFSFQFMLSVIGTVMWITHSGYIAAQVGGNMWFLVLGFTYNAVMVSLLVLVTLRRGIVGRLIDLCVSLGIKLRLVRKPEETRRRAKASVDSFHESIQILISRPRDLIVQMLIGAAQLMFLMSILYFIYLGLHQTGATFGEIVSMDIMEYFSAAWMPMPGASGAQEVTFSLYFGGIFSENVRLVALLMWRFFTYYLSLIVGFVVLLVYGWRAGADPIKERELAEKARADAEAGTDMEDIEHMMENGDVSR